MKKIILTIMLVLGITSSIFARGSYLNRGIGFGASIGNPIINYVMSFPFVDFEMGYGGTNGINLAGNQLNSKMYDFNLFALAALDFIFTIPLVEKWDLGLGLGSTVHISSHTSSLGSIEIGFGFRFPIAIFYDITEHVELGMKIAPSIEFVSTTPSLMRHELYAGLKTNILGGIFAKYYI